MFDEETLAARHMLYATFQNLLGSEPRKELFEILNGDLLGHACEIVRMDEPAELIAALAAMRDDVERFECERGNYTRLLVGPNKLPSPPWESVYATKEDALFQTSTLDVRNAYRVQGFLPECYPRVADDHIALECGFLACMGERALSGLSDGAGNACDECLTASYEFLCDHPLKWVDSFADGMRQAAPGSLYAIAASDLARFMHADEALLRAKRRMQASGFGSSAGLASTISKC